MVGGGGGGGGGGVCVSCGGNVYLASDRDPQSRLACH